MTKPALAIIGTGMAALACADGLAQAFDLSLFDKSRGLSGRLSTRRAPHASDQIFDYASDYASDYAFDHGAPFFHADTAAFKNWLQSYEARGAVTLWTPRHMRFSDNGARQLTQDAKPKWVFTPGMSAVGKSLIAARPQWNIHTGCAVDAVTGVAGAWVLSAGEQRFGPFAHVVFAIPPQQALALLPEGAGFGDALTKAQMLGCHTLMLGYQPDEAPDLDWAFADFDDEVLGLACVNSMKPGREGGFALVLQTRHDWSQAHIEDDLEMVSARIKQRFQELTGCSTAASAYDSLHRWRYASTCQAAATQAQPYLLDDEQGLSAIGDWCSGSGVEQAFLSGARLAATLSAMQDGAPKFRPISDS